MQLLVSEVCVHWLLQKSKVSILIIASIAFVPTVLALGMQYQLSILFTMLTLSPLLFYILRQSLLSVIDVNNNNTLSWQHGLWTFHNNEMSISGNKLENSFAFSLVIFLSIKDNKGQKADLWLFPDSIMDTFCIGFIRIFSGIKQSSTQSQSEQGWRHLHCCFHLSE